MYKHFAENVHRITTKLFLIYSRSVYDKIREIQSVIRSHGWSLIKTLSPPGVAHSSHIVVRQQWQESCIITALALVDKFPSGIKEEPDSMIFLFCPSKGHWLH